MMTRSCRFCEPITLKGYLILMRHCYLLVLALITLTSTGESFARPSADPDFKKNDSMLVTPDALFRVPVPLQVAAWASFHELHNRGLVVDPTLAMLSGVKNPFCVKEISFVILKDTFRLEFKVDSLCVGALMAMPPEPLEPDTADTTAKYQQDIQVKISSGILTPVKYAWPQTMPLDSATIRALYKISFEDKGDLGWHELFGSFDNDELLVCDSTRAVIIR